MNKADKALKLYTKANIFYVVSYMAAGGVLGISFTRFAGMLNKAGSGPALMVTLVLLAIQLISIYFWNKLNKKYLSMIEIVTK